MESGVVRVLSQEIQPLDALTLWNVVSLKQKCSYCVKIKQNVGESYLLSLC